MLPSVVAAFVQRYPAVKLELHQGSPRQVCDMVLSGEADIAIATEAIAEYNELVMLPCYQWNRCVIAPKKHPILNARPLTLEEIAKWPVITYDSAFTGRSQINKAFVGRGLKPKVVLTAIDSDVIKTYVAMGLGSESSPPWPTIRTPTPRSACSTPRICSNRAPPASAYSGTHGCAAMYAPSSNCSRPTCRSAWSKRRLRAGSDPGL